MEKGSLLAGAGAATDLAKVYGEAKRCPACGAFAEVVPDPEQRWVCAVCGAPRVRMPEDHAPPEETTLALREAANAQRTAALQRLTVWACGVPAALTLLLAIVLAPASFLAGGVLVGAGIVLALLSSRASRRAATERKRVRSAVDRAYEAAAAELVKAKLTPAQIAAGMHITEADVETLLTTLSAQAQVRVALDPLAAAASETEIQAQAEAEAAQVEAEEAATADKAKR